MLYEKNEDLPDSVQNVLPSHGQEIYRKAFNSAWEQYKDPEDRRGDDTREEVAHQVAWAAVKKVYVKDEDSGKWVKKEDRKDR